MSDLKTVLAETLREALASEHPFNGGTFPRWFRVWINEASEKAADALLGLPGVAVTQLPEPIGVNGNDNRVWSHTPNYIEQEFEGDVIINDRLGIDADHLRNTAAILLAAAVVSEGETR